MEWLTKINVDDTIMKSFLLPIVAAIVTTLLVEYFAKPWLEARKERLIRNRKQIDEIIFQFQKASGSISAILPDDYKHPLKVRHNEIMLQNSKDGLYGIMEAVSRLPHRYVQKHNAHISKTILFAGYLISQTEHASVSQKFTVSDNPIDYLKEMAKDLEHFDVYFLANISSQDSQEKWYRRLYWKIFMKTKAINSEDEVLKKYGLEFKK